MRRPSLFLRQARKERSSAPFHGTQLMTFCRRFPHVSGGVCAKETCFIFPRFWMLCSDSEFLLMLARRISRLEFDFFSCLIKSSHLVFGAPSLFSHILFVFPPLLAPQTTPVHNHFGRYKNQKLSRVFLFFFGLFYLF